MVRSGKSSPTLIELNSRSAIVEATLSTLVTPPGERRVVLLDYVTVGIGDDVLGHDDVGAVRLPDLMEVHVAVKLVTCDDRFVEFQHLIHLNDLFVGDPDAGRLEHRQLGGVAEHRDERQRSYHTPVTEIGRGLVAQMRGGAVLDRVGVLANLLPLDQVVAGISVVRPDEFLGKRQGQRDSLCA